MESSHSHEPNNSCSKNPAMLPSSSPPSESGFSGTSSPVWPARSPSIQFVSNVVVGDGDAVAASLSACPSTSSSRGSSSDIEIQVLFQGNDDYYVYDHGYSMSTTTASPAVCSRSTSFHGCSDDGELDMEAGRSRLLRAQSMEEFVERDSTGGLKWSALERGGGLQFASRSRSNAG